jgi:hypothetical protein
MSKGSFVLLQASVADTLHDSVIELSPRQLEALGHPVIVRLQRLDSQITVVNTKKGSTGPCPGMKLLVETAENAELEDDSCRLSSLTISNITGMQPGALATGVCVRLSLLERLAPHAFQMKVASDEKTMQQRQRAQLVVDMQTAMATLTYEKEWYQNQVMHPMINLFSPGMPKT